MVFVQDLGVEFKDERPQNSRMLAIPKISKTAVSLL